MKKILKLVVSYHIIVTIFSVAIVGLAAALIIKGIYNPDEGAEKRSDEYIYYNERFFLELVEDENDPYYIITRIKSEHQKDDTIEVPDTIDNIPVRKLIGDNDNFTTWKDISVIKIGKNVEYIGTEKNNDGILRGGTLGDSFVTALNSKTTAIVVHEENLVYASSNGILFNKDLTILIRYPNNKIEDDETFTSIIPSSVVKIYNKAYYLNRKIKVLKLNDSLKEIGNFAFYGCENLINIQFNEGLEKLGNESFRRCSLTVVNLPTTLQSIGNLTFAYNKTLERVNVNSQLLTAGTDIFNMCSANFAIWTTENNAEYLKTLENLVVYNIKFE